MNEDMRLLEGLLSDMRTDLRAIRADLHTFMSTANRVDAEQGALIAGLQARMSAAERGILAASSDRSRIWERIWQFGVTGAIVAQIVMGNPWESVVK